MFLKNILMFFLKRSHAFAKKEKKERKWMVIGEISLPSWG